MFQHRIEKYCQWGGSIYESISYGDGEEEKAMVDWLVDDGIAKRSHRKAIFNPGYVCIGVGVSDHTEHGRVYVVDYGA